MKWTPINMGGGHAVCQRVGGQLVFCRRHGNIVIYDTAKDAKAACRQLNGALTPAGTEPERFEATIARLPMSRPMVDALRDICVGGKTWREAATSRGVTESGILRAMRRVQAQA